MAKMSDKEAQDIMYVNIMTDIPEHEQNKHKLHVDFVLDFIDDIPDYDDDLFIKYHKEYTELVKYG